jgi:UDP-sugar transporter A1/2/3
MALFLLTFGIAVVQVPEASLRVKSLMSLLSPHENEVELMVRDEKVKRGMPLPGPVMNASLGLAAVLAASVTSGLTGVYFEKVVKNPSVSVSIWIRNVQLSFYSLFPALFLGVWYTDGVEISRNGFFVGYNSLVWMTIVLQVLGGFTSGLCIVHLDNIAKNFALCVSIIVSLFAEVYLFGSSIPVNVSLYSQGKDVLTDLSSSFLVLGLLCLHYSCIASSCQGSDQVGHFGDQNIQIPWS